LLSGGGARAAYQVGVISAIAQWYPRNHAIPFSILCGTSAGAINATALGCYASCYRLGVKKLEYIWRNFHCDQVFYCRATQMSSRLLKMMTRGLRADYAVKQSFALLDNTPLRQLLNRHLPYPRIDRNIRRGRLNAVCVTASNYHNGNSISFYQGQHNPWQRNRRLGQRTMIQTEHLLASSAIPMLLPPSLVGQDYYGDGSVHQLSPLSPAIHLGANSILSIHLDQHRSSDAPRAEMPAPSSATIAGHLLDTIFTDSINTDLERLERVNLSLSHIPPEKHPELKLRPIQTLSIRPTGSFDELAHQYFDTLPMPLRLLLRILGINQDTPSSITSYLMFEREYTRALIQQGIQDAMTQEKTLRQFLGI
jgi:NTE family protein